jgi:hypothetical protein
MKHKHALMLLLIFFCTFAICLSVYADDSTISGCYKKMNGQLRIVGKGSKCLPSESSISWNQAGPQLGRPSISVHPSQRQMKAADFAPAFMARVGWLHRWAFNILTRRSTKVLSLRST